MKRCTIKDIATAAGTSHTTVSLALRNHPKISVATRDKIKKLATAMNYHADPMLGSLVAYRQQRRYQGFRESLIWVTDYPTKNGWKTNMYKQYYEGACSRAEELGYKLHPIWLGEYRNGSTHFKRVLSTRNIRGALICPLPDNQHSLDLPWDRLAAVGFGHSMMDVSIHKVTCDHYTSMILAIHRLKKEGYLRIGLAIPLSHDARVRYSYSAAYLSEQNRTTPRAIPIFYCNDQNESDKLKKWISAYKLDSVITVGYGWPIECLEKSSIKIPVELGILLICAYESRMTYTSIDEDAVATGASAIDLLSGMLYRNEYGIPEHPKLLLTQPKWRQGNTTLAFHKIQREIS